jgi:predicted metal-dependent phosphoesterase TrpH
MAKRMGIGAMSLTDHDTMSGVDEAVALGEKLGVKVAPGIEISATSKETGRRVHVLGYWIKDRKLLETTLKPILDARNFSGRRAIGIINDMGIPIAEEDVKAASLGGTLYKQHIMRILVEMGWSGSLRGEIYDKLFGRNGVAKYTDSYITAEKAIALVQEAGGLAVLAHPYRYDTLDQIPKLVDSGLNGIEVWHDSTEPKNVGILMAIAQKHGLFVTGGSDYHGSNNKIPRKLDRLLLPEDNPVLAPMWALPF